ncbi:MAG: hypothetical protein AAF825_11730 [Pseudomonadota bacterium]
MTCQMMPRMFRDLIEYVRNPYPWHLAPMGYVREVTMTGKRGASEAHAWDSHLASTRAAIEACLPDPGAGRGGAAMIIGAGNLLDIPLEALSASFEDVALVDIFHPRFNRARIRGQGNIRLVQADVTGVSRAVFDAARRRRVATLPKPAPPNLSPRRVDLIVSVNLLSQLSVIPCAYLQAHCPGIPPARLDAFARELRQSHLDWLGQSAHRVCLVSDVTRIERFTDGREIRKDIVAGVNLPAPDLAWDWHIAPLGGVYRDRDVTHRVQAHLDYRP